MHMQDSPLHFKFLLVLILGNTMDNNNILKNCCRACYSDISCCKPSRVSVLSPTCSNCTGLTITNEKWCVAKSRVWS